MDVRMVQRALGRWSREQELVTGYYGAVTCRTMASFQRAHKITPARGWLGQRTLDKLEPYFDAYGKWRYRMARVPDAVPDLGPFVEGGKSVLHHDLTHATGGLAGYPAFDDGFRAGTAIIAPEPLRVYRASSARRRDGRPNGMAFYARGESRLDYWVGHTTDVPPMSARARATRGRLGPLAPKGAKLTTVSANHEAPHGHFGINASALVGHELEHHTDYTHGATPVGEQLRKALK